MNEKKFDPKKLKKLNNPERLKDIPPEYILSRLNLQNPEVLVEVGAGTAFFSKALLDASKASKIYACDMSEIMINYIEENVACENPGIIPVKNDESKLPLEDETADLIFTIALHHELEEPSEMLKEVYRVLKPGGKIFIVDWLKKDMDEGPSTEIRCLSEDVGGQLKTAGFFDVNIYQELPKHFLVTGEKS